MNDYKGNLEFGMKNVELGIIEKQWRVKPCPTRLNCHTSNLELGKKHLGPCLMHAGMGGKKAVNLILTAFLFQCQCFKVNNPSGD